MKVDGQHRRTIWPAASRDAVAVIDQRWLPHRLVVARLDSVAAVHQAIRAMWVRGAPLIGVTAAYGLALQTNVDVGDEALDKARRMLDGARPTAVNLSWATARMLARLLPLSPGERRAAAWDEADAMAEQDAAINAAIGDHGLALLRGLAAAKGSAGPLQVLTHCNAGWLATVDWGTALAPIYKAHAAGLALHVWVDETRPRNQGAALTAWELGQAGVPHTVIADNAGGHLMQRGEVNLVLVGADRVTARGDVCNKIGTYLKALAAADSGVPFHVAVPLSTLDLSLGDGLAGIMIEARDPREVTHVTGRRPDGTLVEVQLTPDGSPALNPAFDVTPARLVSGLITECGLLPVNEAALRGAVASAEPRASATTPPASTAMTQATAAPRGR